MEPSAQPGNDPLGGPPIDYDRLDVAEINERIRAAAAVAAPADSPRPPAAPSAVPTPPLRPPRGGFKAKLKGRLRRLLVPFFPLLRLLALPVHEDLAGVIRSLDETNRRVDHLYRRLEDKDRSIEYIKLLHLLGHNLVVEMTKLRIEHDALKSQLRLLEKDLEFLTRRERALERRDLP